MTEQNMPSSDESATPVDPTVLAAVRQAIKEEKSDKKKKELKQLLIDLKDGSVTVTTAIAVLSFRGIELSWSKAAKPLMSGALNFVTSAWKIAKEKNTKNEDK